MSKTACWATNEEFDCAWVYFGYGSRFDMMNSPGYWLSLKALCAIVEYDYDLHPMFNELDLNDPKERILADQLGLEKKEDPEYNISRVCVPPEQKDKIPSYIKMQYSPIGIHHPDGIEKSVMWYEKVIEHAGKHYKNGYEEHELYWDYRGNCRYIKWNIPSLQEIEKINPLHFQWIKNIKYRENILIEMMSHRPDPWAEHRAKPEDIQNMLDEWDREENERYEEFKKKNIWGQL